jgi:hypothetical protein
MTAPVPHRLVSVAMTLRCARSRVSSRCLDRKLRWFAQTGGQVTRWTSSTSTVQQQESTVHQQPCWAQSLSDTRYPAHQSTRTHTRTRRQHESHVRVKGLSRGRRVRRRACVRRCAPHVHPHTSTSSRRSSPSWWRVRRSTHGPRPTSARTVSKTHLEKTPS